jgi:hypothetical protein
MDGVVVTIELPAELFDRVVEEVVQRLRHEQVPSPRWLCGAAAAATYLDWPVARVYRSLRRLPHSRDGRRLMFHTGQLDQFLEEQYEGPGHPTLGALAGRGSVPRAMTHRSTVNLHLTTGRKEHERFKAAQRRAEGRGVAD